jgi:hypothetical protein
VDLWWSGTHDNHGPARTRRGSAAADRVDRRRLEALRS